MSAQGDDGYKAANAISGTSFNTALLDLPRPVEVITAEFIEDIGAREIGEALKYSGSMSDNGTATPEDVTGNNFYNRGFQSFTSYRNGYRSYGVVDTLFIDEGFGSLDAATLDVAIDALESLQSEGRKVGVISHVGALHDRIAVRIRVVKAGVGRSRVEVDGGR